MPAIQRSPRLTQSVGVASGVYRQFTPNADITITGLRDTAPHNTTVRAVIWNANTQARVAISPVVTAPSTAQPYSVMFASPVALTAGVPYMIGMYSESGQLRASDLIENLAYAGFTVDHQTHYDPYRSNYPNSTIATVDKWGPTFDLLQPATAQKGVIGPVDMVDMPTVAAIADLPASSWAMLDDGVSAPRPVRRRADGSVWYGAAFTNTL
ncbi:hypothetical protein D3875_04175 [Deinococcus cavernae]|uniref:Uncharacterized protein n=2 Tax=Deinococcus cavernae TaxID=2320857 RepID=A0A418VEF1_9DEIO|nr:hypothetical protein D3875_04175 [Deinococcus cavernae]